MRELIEHREGINRLMARYGVKFGIYKNNEFHEQLFPFDPMPRVISAKEFELTDADYEEFKNKVKGADFKYDQQSEKILNTLKEAAEFEGYMKDASDEFKALENKLKHNLDRDLDYFSKDIKKMIAEEIIKRYYYQEGAIIQQLKDDKDLDEAVKVLTNPERYQQILSVTAVTAKKE